MLEDWKITAGPKKEMFKVLTTQGNVLLQLIEECSSQYIKNIIERAKIVWRPIDSLL